MRILVQNRWPWRLHATYDETISRALDVFEKVNQDIPLDGLHWFFDHAETISDQSIDRIAALGGGIAVQHRMAYQGEYFVERYGCGAAEATPPVRKNSSIRASRFPPAPTRRASPPTIPGSRWPGSSPAGRWRACASTPQRNCLDRETALRMWTENVTWFSNEEGKKGRIEVGQFADLIVPDRDYFACAENEIADITSDLTVVGGRIVYGAGDFKSLDDDAPPPAMPDWSPVRTFGGYGNWAEDAGKSAKASRAHAVMHACGCANACARCTATIMPARGRAGFPFRISRAFGARSAAPAGRCEMYGKDGHAALDMGDPLLAMAPAGLEDCPGRRPS